MGSSFSFRLFFLLLGCCVGKQRGGRVLITGNVSCDHCRNGRGNHPLDGIEVTILCGNGNGVGWVVSRNKTLNSGVYSILFDSKVRRYTAYVSEGENNAFTSGKLDSAHFKEAKFANSTNGMDFYTVRTLPIQPKAKLSIYKWRTELVTVCSHEVWRNTENLCHWVGVRPEQTAWDVFFPGTAPNTTLLEGLGGKAEVYKTYWREAITSLLNLLYNKPDHMSIFIFLFRVDATLRYNSEERVLHAAWALKKENANSQCALAPCTG